MGFSDYLDSMMDKLSAAIGGDGGAGHDYDQRELPILRAADLVTLMTQFAPSVVSAVTRFQIASGELADASLAGTIKLDPNRVPNSQYVNDDGTPNWSDDVTSLADINAGKGGASISVAQYVAGLSNPAGPAWRRYTINPVITYDPCRSSVTDQYGGTGPISMVRQLMDDWQACVDSAALTIGNDGGANAQLPAQVVEGFYRALGKLAVDLDVLSETSPDTSTFAESYTYAKNKVEGALKDVAVNAGQAAGWVANQAGDVAGQFAKGFFNQATLLTLAIGAIAVFVLLR